MRGGQGVQRLRDRIDYKPHRIAWRRSNLVVDPAPGGRFDAVFCRNVLFYLAPDLRPRVLSLAKKSGKA